MGAELEQKQITEEKLTRREQGLEEGLTKSLGLAFKFDGSETRGHIYSTPSNSIAQAIILKKEKGLSDQEASTATEIKPEVLHQATNLYMDMANGLSNWVSGREINKTLRDKHGNPKLDEDGKEIKGEIEINSGDVDRFMGITNTFCPPSERLKGIPTNKISTALYLRREGFTDEQISHEVGMNDAELVNESVEQFTNSLEEFKTWLKDKPADLNPNTEVHLQTAESR